MAAPLGNQFWRARSRHGANPKFENAEDLWDACSEYFKWCEENPLKEAKAFSFQGDVTIAELSKMRAFTIDGMCDFIDVSNDSWENWRKNREDLFGVIARVERIIRVQKFEGAAADLLNPNIIARDLGLTDKVEKTEIRKLESCSDEELEARLAELRDKQDDEPNT